MSKLNNIEVSGELVLHEINGKKKLSGFLTVPNPMIAVGFGLNQNSLCNYEGPAVVNGQRKGVVVDVFINQVANQTLKVTSSGIPVFK